MSTQIKSFALPFDTIRLSPPMIRRQPKFNRTIDIYNHFILISEVQIHINEMIQDLMSSSHSIIEN